MGSECVLTAEQLEAMTSVDGKAKLPSISGEQGPAMATPSKEERIRHLINSIESEAEPSEANLGYVDPHQKETQYTPTEVRIKRAVQHEPEGYAQDVRSAFSGLPKVKPQWRDYYMKMLIVGECGQGKTTFIKNLFASYTQDPNLKVNDVPGATSKDTFVQHPEKLQTEIVVRDERNLISYHYRVQDTPGYDNMEVNLEPVLDYLKAQNYKALEHEQSAKRVAGMDKWEDPRVDVCVYFIAPHRLKQMDVEFMKKLSLEVPVLPVLAKADCMTTAELEGFREHVRTALHHASKEIGRPIVHEFSREALAEAGATHTVPPFSIVSSNTMDLSVGRFWPVREYPWGSCEALSSRHSDLAALKKLLFEVSYMELKDATEARYYHYRESQLLDLDDSTMPIHRRSLTRQLRSLAKQPTKPTKNGVLSFLSGAAKFALQGAVVYLAVTALQGQHGKERLKEDFQAVAEKTVELKDQVVDLSGTAVEKTKEVGSVVAEKAVVAKDKVGDAAVHAKDSVEDVLSSGASQAQKQAEQAKRNVEERRQQEELEKRRRKQKKKFGMF
ncbi:hypothetical protein ABBQ38_002360 [Trebouxia sp. C0009 RCD-2024]